MRRRASAATVPSRRRLHDRLHEQVAALGLAAEAERADERRAEDQLVAPAARAVEDGRRGRVEPEVVALVDLQVRGELLDGVRLVEAAALDVHGRAGAGALAEAGEVAERGVEAEVAQVREPECEVAGRL